MTYTPSKKVLEKYADLMVNFAAGGEKGIQKGDVVRLTAGESAKPLFVAVRDAILKAGGHVLPQYVPEDINRTFYELAENHQLEHFPAKYMKGVIDEMDHSIYLISTTNPHELKGVDPSKMMQRGKAMRQFMQWRNEKENNGKFTWTLCLYGTPAMAKEAGITEKQYWDQIIKACYLDKADPKKEWRRIYKEIYAIRDKLNLLTPKIDKLHIFGPDADLFITPGEKRRWVCGTGRNMPSFEIFTSPDWRGTNGWIRFNQPLYRYGNLIEGIELWFEDGKVVKSKATKNEKVLKAMIATEGADRLGEYSLTDKRHSRITRFMAETLFDENMGGAHGNTHVALGNCYHETFVGDPTKMKKDDWARLGYNDSSVHTDIISTAPRTVVAHMSDGSEKVIYKNGIFQV